eukprot:924789-Rhodomonas_salina.1
MLVAVSSVKGLFLLRLSDQKVVRAQVRSSSSRPPLRPASQCSCMLAGIWWKRAGCIGGSVLTIMAAGTAPKQQTQLPPLP